MDIDEFYRRFPGVPRDLRDEPVLAEFACLMNPWLAVAQPPSACARVHDVTHRYFLKLIGPLEIYGYGLATREETLAALRSMCDRRLDSQEEFEAMLRADDRGSSGNNSEKVAPEPSSDSS